MTALVDKEFIKNLPCDDDTKAFLTLTKPYVFSKEFEGEKKLIIFDPVSIGASALNHKYSLSGAVSVLSINQKGQVCFFNNIAQHSRFEVSTDASDIEQAILDRLANYQWLDKKDVHSTLNVSFLGKTDVHSSSFNVSYLARESIEETLKSAFGRRSGWVSFHPTLNRVSVSDPLKQLLNALIKLERTGEKEFVKGLSLVASSEVQDYASKDVFESAKVIGEQLIEELRDTGPVNGLSFGERNWLLCADGELRENRLAFIDAVKEDFMIAKEVANTSYQPLVYNQIQSYSDHAYVEQLFLLYTGCTNLINMDKDASEIVAEIESGDLLRRKARINLLNEMYSAPINKTVFNNLHNYLRMNAIKDSREALGFALLNIDPTLSADVGFFNQYADQYASLSLFRTDVCTLLKYVNRCGLAVLESYENGGTKQDAKEITSQYDFLKDKTKTLPERIDGWALRDDFKTFDDYTSIIDQLIVNVHIALIDMSGIDKEISRYAVECHGSHIHVGYESIADYFEQKCGKKYDHYEVDRFCVDRIVEANKVSAKKVAELSQLAHNVVQPELNVLKRQYIAENRLKDDLWQPLISSPIKLDCEYSLVPVHSLMQLNHESSTLNHCVDTYYSQARSGECFILSVRDQKGDSVATIELNVYSQGGEGYCVELVQMQGRKNKKTYPAHLDDLVEKVIDDMRSGKYMLNLDTQSEGRGFYLEPIENRNVIGLMPIENLTDLDKAINYIDKLLPSEKSYLEFIEEMPLLKGMYDLAIASQTTSNRLEKTINQPNDTSRFEVVNNAQTAY
ncbi:PcfJ domain-containing protein [Photobacterium leiognathi]|uniref:PcfJ domain-containing protein n=1 Tax=Photobacterium leiognathi TaxID=553611 RepID=UPI002982B742|nr:PcfJ domain-containing protein [Photobacterium leiognathi]